MTQILAPTFIASQRDSENVHKVIAIKPHIKILAQNRLKTTKIWQKLTVYRPI